MNHIENQNYWVHRVESDEVAHEDLRCVYKDNFFLFGIFKFQKEKNCLYKKNVKPMHQPGRTHIPSYRVSHLVEVNSENPDQTVPG